MARAGKNEPTSKRTVVLLREGAKKKLERLAAKEKVSSGEIIRRSLDSYETTAARVRKEEEEKWMEATLALVIDALRSANRSLVDTCDRLDELHHQLNPEKARESGGEPLHRGKGTSSDIGTHQAA